MIKKIKEVINSTSRTGQGAGQGMFERGKGMGPGTALSPKSVVGTQLFLLILFFVSYPHVINILCIYSIFRILWGCFYF